MSAHEIERLDERGMSAHERNGRKAEERRRSSSPVAPTAGQYTARVLLVEDDDQMRFLMRDVLVAGGYEVYEAADGARFAEYMEQTQEGRRPVPDLIISDIRMPGQSGLAVVDEIRRTDWATPIIFVTAFGDRTTHEEGARLGAVAVLNKPFELDELLDLATSWVPPIL